MGRYPEPQSILVLDNARVHAKDEIFAIAQRFGIFVLFLPTYSFDYNSLELLLHLSKQYIRLRYGNISAANPSASMLSRGLLNAATNDAVCNMFRHCGVHVTDEARAWANDESK